MSGALEKSRELSSTKAGRQSILTMLGITGSGGRYFCPFCQMDGHRHKTPDLSIDGGFKCHRCGWSGDGLSLVQEVKNVSFDEAAAFISGAPVEVSQAREKTKQNRIYPTLEKAISAMGYGFKQGDFHLATRYDYTDSAGTFQYCVLRFEKPDGKAFCQIRRVSDGYIKGLPEHRILYGLEAVTERPTEAVFIVEGEKCADVLHSTGLLATCSVGGSGAPLKTDWTPLQDRECYILPDNDQPGMKYAGHVKQMLAHAKVVTLPGLPPKGDCVDWLDAGHSVLELQALCNAAEDVAPEPEPETPPDEAEQPLGADSLQAQFFRLTQNRELPAAERNRLMTSATVEALEAGGRFYYHAEYRTHSTAFYFDAGSKILFRLGADHFNSWLADFTALNRKDKRFEHVKAGLEDYALLNGQGIIPAVYWARSGDAVYVSCGAGQMAKITADNVAVVDNGTDGVLFGEAVLKPWTLTDPQDPFEACQMFKGASFCWRAVKMMEMGPEKIALNDGQADISIMMMELGYA